MNTIYIKDGLTTLIDANAVLLVEFTFLILTLKFCVFFFLTFQIDTTKRTLLLCIADEANEKKCFLLTKK